MARVLPAKRPHELSEHHLASLDGIAGSSRSKRARHSVEAGVEPSKRSYATEIASVHSADDGRPATTAEQEEAKEQEAEEAAYVRASQTVIASLRAREHKENMAAECGIIEEIRCTSFMCHEQLTVPLGPLINFIIGHNGSGKSAVLTALTLCLGGKATATNRGQSLKSFIKEGRDSSVLSVRIKNQGSGAYRPEQYGDSVVVERHFTRSGTSGYKLKDRNGRIVSTKKAELENIIDWFGLQIDNPMNVLTQDMARQFLNDSNSKDKYKFFLKGTQLEQLDGDYAQIAQMLDEMGEKCETMKSDAVILENKYKEAHKKAVSSQRLEKLRTEEHAIGHQAAWAQVVADEGELAEADEEIERTSEIIDDRKKKADEESAKYAAADEALNNATAKVEECQAHLEPARDEVKEVTIKWNDVKRKVLDCKGNERQILGVINSTQRSMKNTQSQMEEHQARQAQADDGFYAQKLDELDQAKRVYEDRKAAWETHDQKLPALRKECQEAKDRKTQSSDILKEKQTELSLSKKNISSLEAGQRNWVEPYPNPAALEKVMRAIEAESRFRERPVGPIGRFVALKKPEWTSILETASGATLNGFVVTSKVDQTLLSAIMKRCNLNGNVYICPKNRIDTSANEPDKKLLTWMRVLNISNDLVRNQLIINHNIEQVVLIARRTEASDFAYKGGALRKNVKICLCKNDTNHRLGHTFMLNESGGANLSPLREWRGLPRMQVDKGPQIQDEKEKLAAIQREIGSLEAAVNGAQEQLDAYERKLRDHNTAKKRLKHQMDVARQDMDRLEEEVSLATPDNAQIEQLEKELVDFEQRLRLDNEQYQDLKTQLDQANAAAAILKTELEDAQGMVGAMEAKLEKCNAEVHRLTRERERALRSKNKALEEVEQAEENRLGWQRRRDELQMELNDRIQEAQTICDRVDVPDGETYESLLQKAEAKKREREKTEKDLGGSQLELSNKALEAKKKWSDAQDELRKNKELQESLARALSTRKTRWIFFRREISARARIIFPYLLSERQFKGELKIDNSKNRMDIEIQPDKNESGATTRQPKTLSGGEKSFSTVCLLLALWDSMGSPIRCLDEFDVFMDNVNREVTMELIIGAARRAVGRQYILITPQSMNNKKVHSMDDVKIIRMTDPERGQTTLPFGQ